MMPALTGPRPLILDTLKNVFFLYLSLFMHDDAAPAQPKDLQVGHVCIDV